MYPEQYAYFKSIMGDPSDNINGLPKYGKKRALAVVNGEKQLTDEQNQIVEENMELINLLGRRNDELWRDEYNYYASVVDTVEDIRDFNRFEQLCEELNLDSVINNKSTWYSMFFAKQRVTNLISELFAD